MITAERKPFDEIYNYIKDSRNVLVLGCGSCVTVCMAGGEKEVGILASQLRLKAQEEGKDLTVAEHTIMRQCDREFYDEETTKKIKAADIVISMACGVGVQYSAECVPDAVVYPALNTLFYGANLEQGLWGERCAGCGECVIADFGGICPIARCSKSLLNGPCGGSSNGKCEVDPENIDCVWQLIYDRMEKLGRLDELANNKAAKNWSKNRDGGPRKLIREDMKL